MCREGNWARLCVNIPLLIVGLKSAFPDDSIGCSSSEAEVFARFLVQCLRKVYVNELLARFPPERPQRFPVGTHPGARRSRPLKEDRGRSRGVHALSLVGFSSSGLLSQM